MRQTSQRRHLGTHLVNIRSVGRIDLEHAINQVLQALRIGGVGVLVLRVEHGHRYRTALLRCLRIFKRRMRVSESV